MIQSTMLIAIVILALIGLSIAFYLHAKANTSGPLVCPMGHDCKKVINSSYGKLFGIRNETFGILFYFAVLSAIILSYPPFGSLIPGMLWEIVRDVPWILLLFFGAIPAAIMSVILTGVQIFKLKTYCSWCLGANFINIIIFILAWKIVY